MAHNASPARASLAHFRWWLRGISIIWWLLGIGFVVFVHWLAIESHALLEDPAEFLHEHLGKTAIAFALTAACGIALYLRTRKAGIRLAAPRQRATEAPKKCLVICVSIPRGVDFVIHAEPAPAPIATIGSGDDIVSLEGINLDADIRALDGLPEGKQWNWQQLLRAIQPHQDVVEHVHLVGSSNGPGGVPGSFQSLEHCKPLIERYLPAAEVIYHERERVDFEDYEALTATLSAIVSHHELKYSYTRGDITVDVTGGQKTASIASASITLNDPLTFQYVQTGESPTVYLYDLVVEHPPPSH